jgi:cytidylate kinase
LSDLKIAIDGPAGAGKSTIARMLAERLGVPYLDTGAMYRAAALLALRAGLVAPFADGDGDRISELLSRHRLELRPECGTTRLLLDGEDVSREIRSPECSSLSSQVAALPAVRQALVALQRRLGRAGGVMEGRDIGTVVLPDADLKVFLTATPEERAQRRYQEMLAQGIETTYAQVLQEQRDRDQRDRLRADSPLQVAEDAVVVDTTGNDPDQVVTEVMKELTSSPKRALDRAGRTP